MTTASPRQTRPNGRSIDAYSVTATSMSGRHLLLLVALLLATFVILSRVV